MASRLVVDTGWLRATAQRLGAVSDALAGESHSLTSLRDSVGAARLADALHDSSGEWTHHRERLLHRVDRARQAAADAAGAFDEVDNELMRALTGGTGHR